MLGSGVNAILTASPTPTLAVYPLAAARDVLVLHAGSPPSAFPRRAACLFQLRPSAAVRADVLGAYAWERGIRRLGVVARQRRLRPRGSRGGRRPLATARRPAGPRRERVARRLRSPVAPAGRRRARARGRRAGIPGGRARRSRARPPRRRLRGAHPGRGRRSGGAPGRRARALDGALILADAFVPMPGTRGARFARAYEARHSRPPSRFAASAYEMATLLAEAAERSPRPGARRDRLAAP